MRCTQTWLMLFIVLGVFWSLEGVGIVLKRCNGLNNSSKGIQTHYQAVLEESPFSLSKGDSVEEFPFWKHVFPFVSGEGAHHGTGVYIGDGYFLTAAHVPSPNPLLINGKKHFLFSRQFNKNSEADLSEIALEHPDNPAKKSDLKLVRYSLPEGSPLSALDPIEIAFDSKEYKRVNYPHLFVGSGYTEFPKSGTLPEMSAGQLERLRRTAQKRWGINGFFDSDHSSADGYYTPFMRYSFNTFESTNAFDSCAAMPGDSGGMVAFYSIEKKKWLMNGIIFRAALSGADDQRGSLSYAVDLSGYQFGIDLGKRFLSRFRDVHVPGSSLQEEIQTQPPQPNLHRLK